MAPGYIVSLIVLGVSLLLLIVFGLVFKKKIDPTLKNIADTQETFEDHQAHFTNEIEIVQTRVEAIVARVEDIQSETEERIEGLEDLSEHASQLGAAIERLKDQSGEFSQGISRNVATEIKEDGPKLAKIFSGAIKRTIQKQKARYQQEA